MDNKKHNTIPQSEEKRIEEIKLLSERAKEVSGNQQSLFEGVYLGDEDIDTFFNKESLNDTADPEKSHRLYYTMMGAMRRNLPEGKDNIKLRRYIYDEKSLFLNRGKDKNEKGIRGSDERQTYIGNFLHVAFDIVNNWIINGANPFDLYKSFYDLNKEHGFRNDESKLSDPFSKIFKEGTTNESVK